MSRIVANRTPVRKLPRYREIDDVAAAGLLIGRKISRTSFTDDHLSLFFEDGTSVVICAYGGWSGEGFLDLEWDVGVE